MYYVRYVYTWIGNRTWLVISTVFSKMDFSRSQTITCLTGQAPAYLADDCQLTSYVSTRRLWSTDTATCVVRRSNNSFGDRCVAAAEPRVWNMLPTHLRLCDSLEQFKRLLKTHLLGVWDRGALWRLVRSAAYKYIFNFIHHFW